MKALARRLARLERHAPGAVELPLVLFLCPGTGEPAAAMIVETGETLEREPGEAAEAFERRAELAGLPANQDYRQESLDRKSAKS